MYLFHRTLPAAENYFEVMASVLAQDHIVKCVTPLGFLPFYSPVILTEIVSYYQLV